MTYAELRRTDAVYVRPKANWKTTVCGANKERTVCEIRDTGIPAKVLGGACAYYTAQPECGMMCADCAIRPGKGDFCGNRMRERRMRTAQLVPENTAVLRRWNAGAKSTLRAILRACAGASAQVKCGIKRRQAHPQKL